MNNRLSILQNDLAILRHELENFEPGKSHFESVEQINKLIALKQDQVKKLTLTPGK